MLLGGDIAHHGSEFKPTKYLPLPDQIEPNPFQPPFQRSSSICPGALFQQHHPKKSVSEPFTQATGFVHDDAQGACQSVEGLLDFDAHDNIFTVIAHDKSLMDVVEFYPKSANDWKKKGWKEQGRWRFLRDFNVHPEDTEVESAKQ
jgi:hypothetical protein